MHELLHWASGARLPIVLVNVNRSMASPWSLGVDHVDTLSQRDTGCLQVYCESAQEVMDLILMTYRLAESVILPAFVCMDGFLLSHYSEAVDIPEQTDVDRFLPPRKAEFRMDTDNPITFGGGVNSDVLYQLRQRMQSDMDDVLPEFKKICAEFKAIFGREYAPLENIESPEKDLVIITNGTMAGTVKAYLKEKGLEDGVSLIKVRFFRPFPAQELRDALNGYKRAIVLDRNLSPGSGGIFAQEIKASLYGSGQEIPITSVVGGLGGVDVTVDHLDRMVQQVKSEGFSAPASEFVWMEA